MNDHQKSFLSCGIAAILNLILFFNPCNDGLILGICCLILVVALVRKLCFVPLFASVGAHMGYVLGSLLDTPAGNGVLPNNLYVFWMMIFVAFVGVGIFFERKKMKKA